MQIKATVKHCEPMKRVNHATNMKTTMQHRPTRLAQITVMPPNAGKDAKQVDRFPTAAGNIKCPALKHRLAIP